MTAPLKDLASGVPAPQWVDAGAGSLSAGQFEETAPALIYAERWPSADAVEREQYGSPVRRRRAVAVRRPKGRRRSSPGPALRVGAKIVPAGEPGPRSRGVCYVCGARDVPRFTVGERLCECEGCLRS